MKRNTLITLILLGLLAVVLVGLFVMQAETSAAQTAEAYARVVGVELDRKKGDDDTIVTLGFDADGQPSEGRARVSGDRTQDYAPGQPVRICYSPEDPSSVRITDHPCGA